MESRTFEFKLLNGGAFTIRELGGLRRVGMFREDGAPLAGMLCLDKDTVLAVLTEFSDVSLPGTFIREVEVI